MAKNTKRQLIETGLGLLLERGYSGLGILAVLEATGTPKGSFYHHFRSKEDFALHVIDTYVEGVHAQLEAFLSDAAVAPLERIRRFFEATTLSYESQGYMGCLMGGIGQELAATSEVFREKIEGCLASISERISVCLDEAQRRGPTSPRGRRPGDGRPDRRRLGGSGAAQPAAAKPGLPERDAGLLFCHAPQRRTGWKPRIRQIRLNASPARTNWHFRLPRSTRADGHRDIW